MRYSDWCVFPTIAVALLSSVTMAIDEILETGLETAASGFVMGGPKSGVQDKAGGIAVAEKATNLADTVHAMDIANLAEGLQNPYEVLFGKNSTDKLKIVKTGTNTTASTNSTLSSRKFAN